MTYFNSSETYEKAIKNQEKGVLKALLVGIIGSDPTFATREFEEAKNYVKRRSREIHGQELCLEEAYVKQEDEYECEPTAWDETYFGLKLVWLRDNFAVSDRLHDIEKIGRYVYENRQTLGKVKVENRQNPPKEASRREKTQKNTTAVKAANGSRIGKRMPENGFVERLKDNWYWAVIIIVVIGLILIIVR